MKNIKIGQYIYLRRRNGFRIFRKTSNETFEPIAEEVFFNPADARKRVYELNGWNLNTNLI